VDKTEVKGVQKISSHYSLFVNITQGQNEEGPQGSGFETALEDLQGQVKALEQQLHSLHAHINNPSNSKDCGSSKPSHSSPEIIGGGAGGKPQQQGSPLVASAAQGPEPGSGSLDSSSSSRAVVQGSEPGSGSVNSNSSSSALVQGGAVVQGSEPGSGSVDSSSNSRAVMQGSEPGSGSVNGNSSFGRNGNDSAARQAALEQRVLDYGKVLQAMRNRIVALQVRSCRVW